MATITCYRCNGRGHIPGFAHVAQGICFLCKGAKTLPARAANNIGFSQQFINGFRQNSYFPADLRADRIKLISDPHPTAESWVLFDGEIVYIGQPVCRSSMWWAIPVAMWDEFKKHYKRVLGKGEKRWPGCSAKLDDISFETVNLIN